MRKLVLVIIALLALFALFRAYSEDNEPSAGMTGVRLQPGLIEVGDGTASLGLSFGLMERSGEETIGSPVVIRALHRGDVISVGGRVTVDSRVEGDLWVVGADAELSPRAEVTGDVVVIGGKLTASPSAAIGGTVSQLPGLKIPFLGVLGTQFSAQALGLAGVALGYVLFGFALFVSSYYLAPHVRNVQASLQSQWRQALITLGISIVAIPLLTVLVIASIVGVVLLPLVALMVFLLALDGYLCLCVRIGALIRAPSGRASEDSLHVFTSGLLTLFLVNVPALVGILLTALRSAPAARVGTMLQALSLALTAAGLAYGFAVTLAHARTRAAV